MANYSSFRGSRDPYDFGVETYQGVPIYHNRFDWAPCVHLHLGLRVGGVNDPAGFEGLSHFLEHLPFLGSAAYPSTEAVKEFSQDLLLDSFNAWTGFESTAYHARFLPKHAQEAIAGMGDVVFRPILSDVDIEHERGIITEEAWGELKHEKCTAFLKHRRRNIFHDHPLGRSESPAGWPDTIAVISASMLREWHRTQYHRGNLVVVIGGAVEEEHIEHIRKLIDAVPDGIRTTGTVPVTIWPAPKALRKEYRWEEIFGSPMKQAQAVLYRVRPTSYAIGPLAQTAMDALYDILFDELREERALVYDVSLAKDMTTDLTLYQLSLALDEAKLSRAEAVVHDEIRKFVAGDCAAIFEKERRIALELIEASEHESDSVVSSVFDDIIKFDRIMTQTEEMERLQAATYEQAAQFIAETFAPPELGIHIVKS